MLGDPKLLKCTTGIDLRSKPARPAAAPAPRVSILVPVEGALLLVRGTALLCSCDLAEKLRGRDPVLLNCFADLANYFSQPLGLLISSFEMPSSRARAMIAILLQMARTRRARSSGLDSSRQLGEVGPLICWYPCMYLVGSAKLIFATNSCAREMRAH